MDGLVDGCLDGWMFRGMDDIFMDGWMDGCLEE